jgi:transcriptional regulator GlxA family with amidase domain
MPIYFHIELQNSPDTFEGPVHAILDVLKMIQTLAALRESPNQKNKKQPPIPNWKVWNKKNSRQVPDLFVMPGWLAQNGPHLELIIKNTEGLMDRLRSVHAKGGLIVAVDNAAVALGYAGLLNTADAVCPWAFMPLFKRLAPNVNFRSDVLWIQQERMGTCSSPVLATELFIAALKDTDLAELATAVAHVLLPNADRQQTAHHLNVESSTKLQAAGSVDLARRWLEAHLTEPYNIHTLSAVAATSPRTLLRHFETTHGISPLRYLHQQRISRAKVLLETTYLPIDQVALACGYSDTGSFRRIFKKTTGELPTLYRQQYRLRASRRQWRPGLSAVRTTAINDLSF